MASYTVAAGKKAVHAKTLVAATVDTVTFADDIDEVEVLTTNGTAAIYFTADGTTPTVDGDGTFILPAVAGAARVVSVPSAGGTVVKLISSGTPTYSVTRER